MKSPTPSALWPVYNRTPLDCNDLNANSTQISLLPCSRRRSCRYDAPANEGIVNVSPVHRQIRAPQMRFYVGARGNRPPKSWPSPQIFWLQQQIHCVKKPSVFVQQIKQIKQCNNKINEDTPFPFPTSLGILNIWGGGQAP